VGTFGDAGIYSFGMYKNVHSFFGGMVVTNNIELRNRIAAEMATLPLQPMGAYLKKVFSAFLTDIVTLPLLFRNSFFWLFRYAFLHNIDAINNKMRIDIDPELLTKMPKE